MQSRHCTANAFRMCERAFQKINAEALLKRLSDFRVTRRRAKLFKFVGGSPQKVGLQRICQTFGHQML